MASPPSRRGSNFCRFLASDVEKTTIFWESTLCEIIAFFRTRQSRCKTKFQKKSLFWGIFPDLFFIMFPFPGYVFTLCFLGGPRRPVGRPKKRHFFGAKKCHFFGPKKMTFFRVRQYGAFWLQRSHCGDGCRISLPTGLNLESTEISTSKLANSKQQMSKSILQFLKCTLISSPLVRWKWPTQVKTLGTLWWGWDLGMMQSTTSAQVSKTFVRASEKMLFFRATAPGWRSEKIMVIWLAGWLAGYLAGSLAGWLFDNWLCGCLAGYWAISYLAG